MATGTQRVIAFGYRERSDGRSIDVTFLGEQNIRDIIRDIEEHAATTVLVELAEELRRGLGWLDREAEAQDRIDPRAPDGFALND
jgi:hypothetical protein